jgi:hypothetical protein
MLLKYSYIDVYLILRSPTLMIRVGQESYPVVISLF